VKHYNGGGSIGMTKDSRCPDAAQLRSMAKKMIDTYGGALIEEFVDGREFTVLVAENPEDARNPIAFVPVEVAFPAGETFKHFDLKWIDYNGMTWKAVEDVALADKLKDMGRKVFLSLQGDSYARADIRMDRDGRLFFLEINPYCGCFYAPECPGSADCILQYDPIGHAGFLKLLFRSALTRQQRISGGERIGIKYRPGTGYGLVALRDIAAGELVEPYEEKAHYLVTKSHVDRSWDKQQKEWFEAYAYPLIGETYVMWSDKPTDWKPLNHGCEPNTWLVGLNQVAKRDIKQGEALSIEYATFCGLNMKEFQCLCGAPSCRRTIKPTDFLQPWVSERYSGHLSCYVREQRLAKGLPV
jgi:D-alanine-D-alanine ligase